jgi:endonuclease/exonuclease/phosphatase family metal-dependent hydrolase
MDRPLVVLTWNILAPPYFQLPAELASQLDGVVAVASSPGGAGAAPGDPAPGPLRPGGHAHTRRLEAHDPGARRRRLAQQVAVIADVAPDLACLQEVWIKDEVLAALGGGGGGGGGGGDGGGPLCGEYEAVLAPRPAPKQDGVALLVRRDVFDVVERRCPAWGAPHNRSAAIAVLRTRAPRAGAPAGAIVVACCTHLTYPETADDRARRTDLARLIAAEVDAAVAAAAGGDSGGGGGGGGGGGAARPPAIIAGDMNAVDDAAVRVFLGPDGGYTSAFASVHGRPPVVSHLDHASNASGVDAVFVTAGPPPSGAGPRLVPAAAWLLPASDPDDAPMTRPVPQLEELFGAPPALPAGAAAAAAAGALAAATGLDASPVPDTPASPAFSLAGGVDGAAGHDECATVALTGDGHGRGGAFAALRPPAALTLADFCNLSDHRPLLVHLTYDAGGAV